MIPLDEILDLEERLQLETAFQKYQELYSKQQNEFVMWEHYYFFLWYTEVESQAQKGGMEFTQRHSIDKLLKPVFEEGVARFSHLAEFNFVAGYTISLFPYYYGDYEEM